MSEQGAKTIERYKAALKKISDLRMTSLKNTPDEVVEEMAELASKALGTGILPITCGYCRAAFADAVSYHIHAVASHSAYIPHDMQRAVVLRLVQFEMALLEIDRINGGADWNGTRTIAREALATTPARNTSQIGEG